MDLRSEKYLFFLPAQMGCAVLGAYLFHQTKHMKFNLWKSEKQVSTNHEGALAFRMTPEMELYSAVSTSMLEDTFYEKPAQRLDRLRSLISKVAPEFVAKLAVYARKEMHMRTVPVVLSVELANMHKGDNLVSRTINQVVQRPDEIMEVLAYYRQTNRRTGVKTLNKLSKQVQKGLAEAFGKFDEYQFAKYDRKGEITLRDALFLTHPKAEGEDQQALFRKIAHQELETPYTWETELTKAGQTGADKKATWEALIDSGRLGYMAQLRNLRNMLEADISGEHVAKVGAFLSNPHQVAKSKQLPFRFLAAYKELKEVHVGYSSYMMDMLENAMVHSIVHIQGFERDTKVLVACDVSGSMQQAVSAKSKILLYDIGLLMGMMLQSRCKQVISGIFGNTWKVVPLPTRGILANVDAFYKREGEVGYATNGYLVIKSLVDSRTRMDKIMIFTDCQLWDATSNNKYHENTLFWQWKVYKTIHPKAKLYVFDLAGHGQAPLRLESGDVHLIAGWSDKVFEVLEALENGADILEMIHQTVL